MFRNEKKVGDFCRGAGFARMSWRKIGNVFVEDIGL